MASTAHEVDPVTHVSADRRSARSLSMGTWLAIALLVVSVLSLTVASLLSLTRAADLADGVFGERARALLALQAGEVERYLLGTRRTVAAAATMPTVAAAADRFDAAYRELATVDPEAIASATDELTEYYRREVVPTLEATTGQTVRLQRLLPRQPGGRYLQQLYVVPGPEAEGADILDAEDGSEWSRVHAELHPVLSNIVARSGLEDLYLIAPDTGVVVYSTGKRAAFATSLEVGPYSGSLLAQAFREVRERPDEGVVSTDLAPYGPLLDRPAGFVVAPVLDGDRLTAVLAGRISLRAIDRIMTVDRQWEDAGFGATGESFLVGADGRMRSVSRAFEEDPEQYLQTVADAATATAQERTAMEATGTTAIYQQAFTDAEMAAATGDDTGVIGSIGYLGRDVQTAFGPIDVPGLEWTVALQVVDEQVRAPIDGYGRQTALALAVVVLVVSFLAVSWARGVFTPVTSISQRLHAVSQGRRGAPVSMSGRVPREFAELTTSVEEMIAALDRRRAEVDAAIEERRAMVRTMLPPAIAERIDSGDRRVVDDIPRASVVVVTVNGLGGLVQAGNGSPDRALVDRVVGNLDDLADRHGLDRVKILGDSYFAGCGLERPYLDHAPRAVAFALGAQDTVAREAGEQIDLTLSIGIDSGHVTIGLSGATMLVYDLWGDTVNQAHLLAQTARPGEILVSDRTRALLPEDVPMTAEEHGGQPVWRVGGAVPAEEPAS